MHDGFMIAAAKQLNRVALKHGLDQSRPLFSQLVGLVDDGSDTNLTTLKAMTEAEMTDLQALLARRQAEPLPRLNLWEEAPHVLRKVLDANPWMNPAEPLAVQLAEIDTKDTAIQALQRLDDASLEDIKFLMNQAQTNDSPLRLKAKEYRAKS